VFNTSVFETLTFLEDIDMARGKTKRSTKKVVSTVGVDKKFVDNRQPVVDSCEGCERVEEINDNKYCSKYAEPSFHWENDQICSFATHVKKEVLAVKKAVNPLKASKRLAKKK
jgi:hypothetical protein